MYNNFRFYSKSTIKEGIVVVVVRQPHVPTCLTAYRSTGASHARIFREYSRRNRLPFRRDSLSPTARTLRKQIAIVGAASYRVHKRSRHPRHERGGETKFVFLSFSSDEIAFRKNLQFFNSTSLRFVWFRERRERKSMRRVGEISRSRGVYLIQRQ